MAVPHKALAADQLLISFSDWPQGVTDLENALTRLPQPIFEAVTTLQGAGYRWLDKVRFAEWTRWAVPASLPVTVAVSAVEHLLRPLVKGFGIQPNHRYRPFGTDPGFANQWALQNNGKTLPWPADPIDPVDANSDGSDDPGTAGVDVSATRAWADTSGSPSVVVAILDTGVALDAPDIVGTIAENIKESVLANGLDNDGNGYKDDRFGYDFCNDDGDPDDDTGHGTGVAAVIAAPRDDGVGIAGLAAGVRVLPIRFLGNQYDAAGDCNLTSAALEGVQYAISRGVDVINMSFGGSEPDQAMEDVLNSARKAGIILVAAAGNESSNNDKTPSYPAAYPWDELISVGAHTNSNYLSSFSNFGQSVEIAAPGSTVYTADAPARDQFPSDNFSAVGGADRSFVFPPTGGDLRLDSVGRWGIATLTTGDRVIILDAGRAFSNTGGYRADSGGTWTSDLVPVEPGTQLRLAGQIDLGSGDTIYVEVSPDKSLWYTAAALQGSKTVEIQKPLEQLRTGMTQVAVRIRPVIAVGNNTGLAGGAWFESIRLWVRSSPAQADLPLYIFTQGTSLAAPYVAATAALLRSKSANIPAAMAARRILAGGVAMAERGWIAGDRRLNAANALRTDPFLFFVSEPGFNNDGADPDQPDEGQPVSLKIGYADPRDRAAPTEVTAGIWQPKGTLIKVTLSLLSGDPTDALLYAAKVTPPGGGTWQYRFFALSSQGDRVNGPVGSFRAGGNSPGGVSGTSAGTGAGVGGLDKGGGCGCQSIGSGFGDPRGFLMLLIAMGLWFRRRYV